MADGGGRATRSDTAYFLLQAAAAARRTERSEPQPAAGGIPTPRPPSGGLGHWPFGWGEDQMEPIAA